MRGHAWKPGPPRRPAPSITPAEVTTARIHPGIIPPLPQEVGRTGGRLGPRGLDYRLGLAGETDPAAMANFGYPSRGGPSSIP